ncbi:hypothetical protein B0H21DRAFT_700969, partial [Amylocystis lapponica]
CFPHVVNRGVQTGLDQLTCVADARVSTSQPASGTTDDDDDNPVKSARSLVTACRASGQRREDFKSTIETGNKENTFGNKKLPDAVLLRDVDTRWSSTFLMIDRVLEMNPAIERFLALPKQDKISKLALSSIDLKVLNDIREFLELPHVVQEFLSAEMTPTLGMVIPAYENLIQALKKLKNEKPEIQHGVSAAIARLEKYFVKVRRSKVCVIATGVFTALSFSLATF